MATAAACSALVDVFPGLLRVRRALAGPAATTPAVTALAAVQQLGTPRVSEVAEHLGLDLSTVSRQVTHLRQRGLLDSAPDPDDGRSQRLSTTEAGTQELRQHRHRLVDRLVERLADWDDREIHQLASLLDRLSHVAGCTSAPATPTSTTPTGSLPARELQRNA